jgi:hypothetical protein
LEAIVVVLTCCGDEINDGMPVGKKKKDNFEGVRSIQGN